LIIKWFNEMIACTILLLKYQSINFLTWTIPALKTKTFNRWFDKIII
jgi:hypothetical protein